MPDKVPKGCVGCSEYKPTPEGYPCKNRKRGVGEIGICVFRPQTDKVKKFDELLTQATHHIPPEKKKGVA